MGVDSSSAIILKTAIVRLLIGALSEYVYYLDTMTENAFLTGFLPKKVNRKTCSQDSMGVA